MNQSAITNYIDHTKLHPTTSREDVIQLCKEAIDHNFAAVCINPCFVSLAAKELGQSIVKVCTVVGFPLGANTSEAKAYETELAVQQGATEIDMVINIDALKQNDYEYVKKDIQAVVEASRDHAIVKVIIETCYLSNEEIVKACELALEAKAHYVKTSTGFGSAGAKVEDIELMRHTVGDLMGVKASGGIKDLNTALAMIRAGASRIGTSSGIIISTTHN
ncbi:deoxyribose-phosphate aldolase [Desulfuribacillus stibiiarsenatis]|uniref:Deoxyribose-phosphate aldolase n=1 Tax=Desulfuribacillus stibiiarsenatis TaxID=1390249 RepID=A0A1E5L7P2_9FIRM|nr:deoxyribose-phosphate aldolase [Desulfuribacillus stibiiarsenatis]OEH86146.1 deoxyribose-phosphate aldolase [Desulfuribacillus stibiiarsenatis]